MGVDLILTTAARKRIAVQAKGYPSGTRVGIKAIQEAHMGADLFRCHAASVITNSRFTKPAVNATQKLIASGHDIRLIDVVGLGGLMAGHTQL
ncbi:MAG: restriction endonuclease [Labilithrix sp.]|nr:restriction endonuclease [Labilithrix sp.]MCW5810820.1 restriction endonuclease [Labilithrix sp.]